MGGGKVLAFPDAERLVRSHEIMKITGKICIRFFDQMPGDESETAQTLFDGRPAENGQFNFYFNHS